MSCETILATRSVETLIPFYVRDANNELIEAAGTLTARIADDGGSFVSTENAPVYRDAAGKYSILLTASELGVDQMELEIVSSEPSDQISFSDESCGC